MYLSKKVKVFDADNETIERVKCVLCFVYEPAACVFRVCDFSVFGAVALDSATVCHIEVKAQKNLFKPQFKILLHLIQLKTIVNYKVQVPALKCS